MMTIQAEIFPHVENLYIEQVNNSLAVWLLWVILLHYMDKLKGCSTGWPLTFRNTIVFLKVTLLTWLIFLVNN